MSDRPLPFLREWLIGLGWTYVSLVWFAFLVGLFGITSHHGFWAAIQSLSPLNLESWVITVMPFSPGVLCLMLGYRAPASSF